MGHFKSPSISNVDLPKLQARTYARLAATTDFPSPFTALVMIVTLLLAPDCMSTNRAAATRNCSAPTDNGLHFAIRSNPRPIPNLPETNLDSTVDNRDSPPTDVAAYVPFLLSSGMRADSNRPA